MVKYIFSTILFLISIAGFGQDKNYYVSMTDGDDARTTEQAQNPATPWKTINKVDNITFQADDSIFFNRGDTWKETFEPYGNGTKNNKIVITAYGTGAKPIITGRDTLSGWSGALNWTQVGATNVWYISVSALESKFRIWINGTEIRKAKHVSWIDATDTFADSAEIDRLYLYSVGNPATVYAGGTIESGWVRSYALYINTRNHYKIEYLDLRGGYYSIRLRAADDIIIDSCNIGNSSTSFGLLGERIASPVNQSDSCTVSNCLFDPDSELTSEWEVKYTENGLEVYGGNDWNIHDNYFKNWGHAGIYILTLSTATNHRINIYDNFFTAPDISYGRGFNTDCIGSNCADLKFYRNIIRNTPTCSQINNYGTQFYYNIIDTVRGVTFSPGYGQGISITGYATSTLPQHMKFYNNVIANCEDQGIYISHYTGREHKKNNEFINNIIYNSGGESIKIYNNATDTGIYDNVFRNNILYNSGSSDIVYYRGDTITVDEFNDENGTEGDEILENIGEDPEFDGTTFELLATSPAINTGVNVGLITDYALTGVPQGTYVDIGAYEFVNFPIATTGLGWEDILSHRNFKGSVNFAGGFSVEGVPIVFSGGSPVNLPGLTASVTELNYTDGVTSSIQTQLDSKADTSLSNLSSVAINTHLLPDTAGTINLGSGAKPFAKVFGGSTIVSDLSIGDSTSNTIAKFDSVAVFNGKLYAFVNGDTIGWGVLTADSEDITDLVIMLTDTTHTNGKHILYTQWQVDSIFAGFTSGFDSVYIYAKVDSLINVVNEQQSQIELLWDALVVLDLGDFEPPFFESAIITSTISDSILIVILDDTDVQQDSIPAMGAFTVKENGNAMTVEAVDIGNDSVYIALDTLGIAGATYTVSYNKDFDYPQLQDSSENITPSFTNKPVTNSIGFKSAEFDTIYAAFSVKPHADTAKFMDNLVYSLDSAGYWDRMDLLYVFANRDSADMYINWIKPGTFNASEGISGYTWQLYEGVTGDAINGRIRTNWIPSEDAENYTQNSASMGVYIRTDLSEGVNMMVAGATAGTNEVSLTFLSGTTQWKINSLSSVYETSSTAAPGMFIVSRTAADACALYKNGLLVESVSDASNALVETEIYLLNVHTATGHQISIIYMMDGTADATESAKINTIFERYMDSLGKGVQ